MKDKSILTYINKYTSINTILSDFYDSIVHRTVHPRQVLRIWAKIIIREFGLGLSIDDLFLIRVQSSNFLIKKYKVDANKIPYEILKNEVYKRLASADILHPSQEKIFMKTFEMAEIRSEQSVQYLNLEMVSTLRELKTMGFKIYLLSDFYASTNVLETLVEHHKIRDIFDGIYSSSSLKHSKENGDIYPFLLNKLTLNSDQVLMLGDNAVSDFENAKMHGLHSYLLPHSNYLRKNKFYNLGSDSKDYKALITKFLKVCKKKDAEPLSEYILIFYVFTERLYKLCKQRNIKNLFFLAREGLYLKKLFDYYQEYHSLSQENSIKTHYFKISRQASLQVSYKPIEEETFSYLKKEFKTLSLNQFLSNFSLSDEILNEIRSSYECDYDEPIHSMFDSDAYKGLLKDPVFRKYYKINREEQKVAFERYIETFNVDLITEGMHVVDIGWGGTMQDALYDFFNQKIKVYGYYLGLKKRNDITPNTKRYGLIYTIFPVKKYRDVIMDVNSQIYEQLLSADHGSTVCYNGDMPNYAVEYHNPVEKALFENDICHLQNFMFGVFKDVLQDSDKISYDDEVVDENMVRLCLKMSLFQNRKDLNFLNRLNDSLYNNIGEFKVGITYSTRDVGSMSGFVKKLIINPEQTLRYFTKLKPALFRRNKVLPMLLPMFLVYYYIKWNGYIKLKFLKRYFYFKYATSE